MYVDFVEYNAERMFTLNDIHSSSKKSMEMTKQYYDLATDFFEYGWGESFHFYVMNKEESRQTSCVKHEYRLAVKLGLKPGLSCLVNEKKLQIQSANFHPVCNDMQALLLTMCARRRKK